MAAEQLTLPPELLRRFRAVPDVEFAALLRTEQRRAWRRGARTRAEDYLAALPAPLEERALIDLIYHEYLLRVGLGATPTADEYVRRFPHLEAPLRRQFALDAALTDSADELDPTPATSPGESVVVDGRLPTVPGYEVAERIGSGGFGVVYRARHLGLNRWVALKMLRAGDGSPTERARLRAEAEAVARLQHPNIVQVYDVGEHEGRLYCALEFVGGGTLERLLRESALTTTTAARLVADLARATQVIHTLNVVHRDLKPGNILLQRGFAAEGAEGAEKKDRDERERIKSAGGGGVCATTLPHPSSPDSFSPGSSTAPSAVNPLPKIADFGLAKFLDAPGRSRTRLGAVLGTPSYMAPEQAAGLATQATAAVDIYALGAILYECLTGRPPFKGATTDETLRLVRTADPVAVRRLQPSVPRDLEAVCLKCLRKDPRHRYAAAAELADDLQRFLDRKPVRARPVGAPERAWRWAVRNPAHAAMGTLLAVTVVVLVAGGWWASLRLARESARAALAESEAAANRDRAETREFFTLVSDARARKVRAIGWSWESADELRRAAALGPAREHRDELRTELAECLNALDVREQRTIASGFTVGRIACDAPGKRIALAEAYNSFAVSVRLLDAETGDIQQTLTYLPSLKYVGRKSKADGTGALAFSPDGRWLVVGTRGGYLHRWDLTMRRPQRADWVGHAEQITDLAFSPDGKALFSVSHEEHKVKRWDVADGWKQTAERTVTERPLAVHPAGAWVCLPGEGLEFVSPETLKPVRPEPVRVPATRLAVSPDGRMIAAVNGRSIALVDTERGEVVRYLRQPGRETAHLASIAGVAFSRDGAMLLSWSQESDHARLWEVASGQPVADWALPEAHLHDPVAAFHPDGRVVAAAGKTTRLYTVGGRDVQSRLAHHPRLVRGFTFAPDGQTLVCLSEDERLRELTRWRLDGDGARLLGRLPAGEQGRFPVGPAVQPDGARVAFTTGDRIGSWGLRDGSESHGFPAPQLARLAFDPDGRLWGCMSETVYCWNFPGGESLKYWKTASVRPVPPYPAVESLAPGRRGVLAGGQHGAAWLLRAGDGVVTNVGPGWTFPTRAAVGAAAWNPDETLAAFGNDAGEVYVVAPDGGREPARLAAHRDIVTALAFHRDGVLVSGGHDGLIRFWRPDGADYHPALTLRSPGPVAALAFTPDGDGLGVLLEGEFAVRLWRLGRLREKLTDAGLGAD